MVDISEQLQIIAGDESGEIVRNAVADAAFIIASGSTIIDEELYTIRNNRYGWQIRTAIHNALEKLAEEQPEPPTPITELSSVVDLPICGQATESGIAAVTSVYPQFSCDAGYYFDSKITCTIDGRIFTKTNTIPAIGVIIHWSDGHSWTQPLFISPTAGAVIYITNYKSTYVYSEPIGSVDYDGITWYYCSLIYAMYGAYNDSEGHLLTYPELVTIQGNNVDPESVLGILQFVHAQKED